jgi:hypothetical protein
VVNEHLPVPSPGRQGLLPRLDPATPTDAEDPVHHPRTQRPGRRPTRTATSRGARPKAKCS